MYQNIGMGLPLRAYQLGCKNENSKVSVLFLLRKTNRKYRSTEMASVTMPAAVCRITLSIAVTDISTVQSHSPSCIEDFCYWLGSGVLPSIPRHESPQCGREAFDGSPNLSFPGRRRYRLGMFTQSAFPLTLLSSITARTSTVETFFSDMNFKVSQL